MRVSPWSHRLRQAGAGRAGARGLLPWFWLNRRFNSIASERHRQHVAVTVMSQSSQRRYDSSSKHSHKIYIAAATHYPKLFHSTL